MNLLKTVNKIKQLDEWKPPDLELKEESQSSDEEMQTQTQEQKKSLIEFVKRIDHFKKLIAKINHSVTELNSFRQQLSLEINQENSKTNEKRQEAYNIGMQSLDQARRILDELNDIIQVERQEELEDANQSGDQKFSQTFLQKQALLQSSQKTYLSATRKFSDASAAQKQALEAKIRRMCRYLSPDLTDDDIDLAVSQGENGLKSVMISTHQEAVQILKDAQVKHQQTVDFAKGTAELLELTMQFSALVEAQSEKLTSIENSVSLSRECVQTGVQNLIKANKLGKASKGCICCMIILGIAGFAVLLLVVLGIVKITK
ncbi:Syntaxin 1A [Spironucleus salmonicida]|uniref:Syntaxin 1A n=1 Tax=Spironucleus salmonicida TaxID=348837 RepID=V6LSZ8_9EUKA|nr:Syntaxin 1A [Spironucleus salmonicida]|eukprot:EST47772.1 Syntaxin 1A [Spironucleus salmonicida]